MKCTQDGSSYSCIAKTEVLHAIKWILNEISVCELNHIYNFLNIQSKILLVLNFGFMVERGVGKSDGKQSQKIIKTCSYPDNKSTNEH